MNSPLYAVVSFIDDNLDDDEEITSEVPSCWLSDDKTKCWWPKTKIINSFISKRILPDEKSSKWEQHSIEFHGYHETLEKARKKADDIQTSSDEADTQKTVSRLRKKKNKLIPEIIEEFSESEEVIKTTKTKTISDPLSTKKKSIPDPPNMSNEIPNLSNLSTIIINNLEDVENLDPNIFNDTILLDMCDSIMPSRSKVAQDIRSSTDPLLDIETVENSQRKGNSSPQTAKSSQSEEPIMITPKTLTQPLLSRSQIQLQIPGTSAASTPSLQKNEVQLLTKLIEDNFAKVLSTLAIMKVNFKIFDTRVRKIEETCCGANTLSVRNNESSMKEIIEVLPFSDIQSIKAFNERLELDEELATKLHVYLIGIGGNGLRDSITRILKKMFTNNIAKACTWCGKRDNFKISNLKCIPIIRAAVSTSFKNTEHEFDDIVAEWFRVAKQRCAREEKKMQI